MESEQTAPAALAPETTGTSSLYTTLPRQAVAVAGNCVPDAAWGTLQTTMASKVVQLTNQHRSGVGLAALVVAPVLRSIAEWKSLNMAGYLYMDHNDPAPVARSIGDRFNACGYPSNAAWGENIAYGFLDAQSVMDAWLSDVGHKANVEGASWTTVGVGVGVASNGLIFWTQDFGTTGMGPPPPPPLPPPLPRFDEWKKSAYPELKGWPAYQTWRAKKGNQHDVKIVDALIADPGAPGTATTAFGLFLAETIRLLAS